MLPEWKQLRKKAKKLKIPDEPYFKLADEYITLKSKFIFEEFMDILYSWIDMVVYPLYIIIRLCMLDFSPMYFLTLVKTYQIWNDWFRLKALEARIESWKETVKSVGGPWISTNDADYHTFVYADGMERIKLSRVMRPSQKTVKTSPEVQHPVQSQASSQQESP
jgi:hypothetical protein